MKKVVFLTVILFSFLAGQIFAQDASETSEPSESQEIQETSERDYVDEQNMTVTEVEELIQSQALIHRLDFVFGFQKFAQRIDLVARSSVFEDEYHGNFKK